MTNVRVDLIYDRDCPNVEQARSMIRTALSELGATLHWTEWDREDARTPNELRCYGSPTVLVNGRDVGSEENESASDASSCRVYLDESCCVGAPSATLIANAIREAQGE